MQSHIGAVQSVALSAHAPVFVSGNVEADRIQMAHATIKDNASDDNLSVSTFPSIQKAAIEACRQFQRRAICPRGKSCKFSHDNSVNDGEITLTGHSQTTVLEPNCSSSLPPPSSTPSFQIFETGTKTHETFGVNSKIPSSFSKDMISAPGGPATGDHFASSVISASPLIPSQNISCSTSLPSYHDGFHHIDFNPLMRAEHDVAARPPPYVI